MNEETRIAILETAIKNQGVQIQDIKSTQKDLMKIIYMRMDDFKNDMHNISLHSKDIVIGQQKEANKNKIWMLGILLGFIAQTATGVLVFLLQR